MQIRHIVIYSHDGQVRSISFNIGALNIVTGGSKTGKTALQRIVDYCLGSSNCNVPAGVIWDRVSWYALALHFSDVKVFIARKHPAPGRKSSDAVHIETGKTSDILPFDQLKGNSTPDSAAALLTRLLGISPNLHTPPENQTRKPLEANLRHALLYSFQDQSEIANQRFLFHKQGEQHMPQTIQDTLPYFLNAVPEDLLSKRRELKTAKDNLRVASRALEEAKAIGGRGFERAYSLIAEARNAALLDPTIEPSSPEEAITLLRSLTSWRTASDLPVVQDQTADDFLSRIQELRTKAQRLADENKAARSLTQDLSGYGEEVAAQGQRMQTIDLVDAAHDGGVLCPICQTELSATTPAITEMQQSFSALSAQLVKMRPDVPRLDELIAQNDSELVRLRRQINDLRRDHAQLLAQQDDFPATDRTETRRAHVVGRISLYLESVNEPVDGQQIEDLVNTVRESELKLQEIEKWFEDLDLVDRLTSVLSIISRVMSGYADKLRMEYAESPLRLDYKKLTVVADTTAEPVSMDRMGSAENWLACHLITHLALHHFFSQAGRPVPRFLMLDQPTQVYYPPEDDKSDGSLDTLKDEDREAVERIFSVLAGFVTDEKGKMQVIVTDHADLKNDVFTRSVVGRWRGDVKLVPLDWLT